MLYLFIPCYVSNLTPRVGQALSRLLNFWGVAWYRPPEQTCCGQFAFNEGDWQGARRLMRHFLKVFAEADEILCPGASCVYTVRRQYQQLVENRREAWQLARIQARLLEFSEWLVQVRPPLPWDRYTGQLLWHHSCAARRLRLEPQINEILSWFPAVEWRLVPETYRCCGFGGLFAVKQPYLSQAIGLAYLEAARAVGAAAAVSTDSSCLLHLQGLAAAQGWHWPVWQLAEFLEQGIPN